MANASSAHACTSKPQAKPLPHIAMTAPGSRILAPLTGVNAMSAPTSNYMQQIGDHASIMLARHASGIERCCYPRTHSCWFGTEKRSDDKGATWVRTTAMVVNNYGVLVEVPEEVLL